MHSPLSINFVLFKQKEKKKKENKTKETEKSTFVIATVFT